MKLSVRSVNREQTEAGSAKQVAFVQCIHQVLQRNRTNRIYIGIEKDVLQKLSHVIKEAEKSHYPPSESCRIRKAGGITQSKSKGLIIWEGGEH